MFSRCLRWGLTLPLFIALTAGAQERPAPEKHRLPKFTGEPFTLVPMDFEDVRCSVEEVNPARPKPYVKLLCPPRSQFAVLRVYLKLSWLSAADLPPELDQLRLPAGGLTKLRMSTDAALVRLRVAGRGGTTRDRWIAFNGLVDLALITEPR